MSMKDSEIKFIVSLDENRVPERIQWEATDSGIEGKKDCKATMLTVWDAKDSTTMRIDLWTKDMPVDDMKRFFYESLISMADTYQRATQDPSGAQEIRKFSESFAQKTALFKS
jgi:gliding motility-associated protein GldC